MIENDYYGKTVATVSQFATAEDYTTLSETVEEIDSHVNHIHDSLVTFTSDHYAFHLEEKEKNNEELNQIKHDLHKLRVALTWSVAGLLCLSIAILALCIHLIS